MKAPDESGVNKDFPEKATKWVATGGGKRGTDVKRRDKVPLLNSAMGGEGISKS